MRLGLGLVMLVAAGALVVSMRTGAVAGPWSRVGLFVLFWLASLGVLQAQGHT